MLRVVDVSYLDWADKTMSAIGLAEWEATEKRLAALPEVTVFDLDSDTRVEDIWKHSYDAQENPHQERLHTCRELRAQILGQLDAEAALLSLEEHRLLEQLISLGGTSELCEPPEMIAAESLVRRLWCSVTRANGHYSLRLAEELITPLTLILDSEAHQTLRMNIMFHDATVNSILHVHGLIPGEESLLSLLTQVLRNTYAFNSTLALRHLRASCDYIYDSAGEIILLHPGLTDPDYLFSLPSPPFYFPIKLTGETITGAMQTLLPEEQPHYERLLGLLQEATRPEVSPENAATDILMLAKHSVPLDEMQKVLGSMLTRQPTAQMRAAVEAIHAYTPRWNEYITAKHQ